MAELLEPGQASKESLDQLLAQLRAIARERLRSERVDHTLQATALVHEAWLKLHGDSPFAARDQAHFLAAAAEAMRKILIDHARARAAVKRGGDGAGRPARLLSLDAARPLSRDAVQLTHAGENSEILAVDGAISRLESQDAELARLIRLRFFAGLTEKEAADALGLSPRSARRMWVVAKAWLRKELKGEDS